VEVLFQSFDATGVPDNEPYDDLSREIAVIRNHSTDQGLSYPVGGLTWIEFWGN
jgi:hypothetical protein